MYEQMFVDSGAIEELVKLEAPLNDGKKRNAHSIQTKIKPSYFDGSEKNSFHFRFMD